MKGMTAREEIQQAGEEYGWDHLVVPGPYWTESDLFFRKDISVKVSYNSADGVRQAEVERPGFAIELIAEKKRRQRVLAVLRSDDPTKEQTVTEEELADL